ncbi:undecaprenyl-diphosphatase [Kineococcus xinjiangensis]|uniref:Undecaprenyl-diphosphatase n=1 Tax=Kineococcus xinjiangensis TaxID=512762 RepID=A0A2S6IKN7_9ACTN|nr:phosphatase PAP2 family protein [Kineococcus xinjiangensis]PPK94736.1 undecaprenyl-diphosphatase [Kineococcus xinjiangensis]
MNAAGTGGAAHSARDTPAEQPPTAAALGRFELRAFLGVSALVLGALPFLALLLLVRQQWEPLQRVDEGIAAWLNGLVAPHPTAVTVLERVTELGGSAEAGYVFALATLTLAVQRKWRLVAYTATTGICLAVLVPLTKLAVGRQRPDVPLPVAATPSDASFPSGHAMTALVTWSVVALLLMPAVRRRARPWLLAAAAAIALIVGLTRLALGVHFTSDVLAGWALGSGVVAVTTATFQTWRHHDGDPHPVREGLQETGSSHHDRRATLPPLQALLRLVLAGIALVGLFTAVGFFILRHSGPGILRWDDDVVDRFVQARTPQRTEIALIVSDLSGTPTMILATLAIVVLGRALSGRWRVSFFAVATVTGETLVYFTTSNLVVRARPDVLQLTPGPVIGFSWPSGHTAAAVALYGTIAVLVLTRTRSRWRWAVLLLPVLIPPMVGASRIYLAAHHPSDVLAGLVLGWTWVAISTHYALQPRVTAPVPLPHGPGQPHASG